MYSEPSEKSRTECFQGNGSFLALRPRAFGPTPTERLGRHAGDGSLPPAPRNDPLTGVSHVSRETARAPVGSGQDRVVWVPCWRDRRYVDAVGVGRSVKPPSSTEPDALAAAQPSMWYHLPVADQRGVGRLRQHFGVYGGQPPANRSPTVIPRSRRALASASCLPATWIVGGYVGRRQGF
jgi:hypothetical protein